MKVTDKLWVVEAHELGALQVRAAADAIALNKKRWLAGGKTDDGRQTTDDRANKADRMLVGIGGTIDEALEVERELKRMKRTTEDGRQTTDDGPEEDRKTHHG